MSEDDAIPELQVGGTLEPQRHAYVVRPEDQQVLDLLLAGEYCNILTSRQMGKSSLMAHVATKLDELGVGVALIDLQDLGAPKLLDDWYLGLLVGITRELRISIDVKSWWSSSEWPTANQRLLAFFREVVAAQSASRVVIFIDEIDQTLKLPYTDDFFVAIRSMYNQRGKEPAFGRIAFCLVGVASPNELIQDKRTTPYNIGRTIELRDFDPQRDDLTELHRAVSPADSAGGAEIVAAVLTWTGGHPYLTASLCSRFAHDSARRDGDLTQAVDTFVEREYVRHDVLPEDEKVHFQRVTEYLSERASDPISTLQLYRRIRSGGREPDRSSPRHIDLKLSGVVKRNGDGQLVVRNRIYGRIFTDGWAKAAMPAAERRVTVARRWAVAAILLLLLSPLVWYELIYPRSLTATLQAASQDLGFGNKDLEQLGFARESFEQLRRIPFYQSRADQLWGTLHKERIQKALEEDRRAVDLDSEPRQLVVSEGVMTSIVDLLSLPGKDSNTGLPWHEIAETGWRDFQTQRLDGAIELDEKSYQEALNATFATMAEAASLSQRHAFRLALKAHEFLMLDLPFRGPQAQAVSTEDNSLANWQSLAAPKLATFFTRRAERAELAEHLGEAVLWRLRALRAEDLSTTREAVSHLLDSDHAGLVRTWGSKDTARRPNPDPYRIETVKFVQEDQRVLIATYGGEIQLWDLAADKLVESFEHAGGLLGVQLSPDESRLLSWGDDGTTRVWRLGQPGPAAVFRNPPTIRPQVQAQGPLRPAAVIDAVFSPNAQRILTSSLDNVARLWDVNQTAAEPRPLLSFRHDGPINRAVFDHDGQRVLTSSDDETAQLWDVSQIAADPRPLRIFRHDALVYGAVFSRDDQRVLTWSNDGTARLWDVNQTTAEAKPLLILSHDLSVHGAVFSRDEQRVLTWSSDGTARLWDVNQTTTEPTPLLTLKHKDVVNGAVFSRDERRVLTWSEDNTARLWDVSQTTTEATPLQTFRHDGSVYGAVFSRDEQRVLTWSIDGTARLWDVNQTTTEPTPLMTFRHDSNISGVVFNRDERSILTWSRDGTVRLWDGSQTPAEPATLQTFRHDAYVFGAVFGGDEQRVLTWSADHTARLWDVSQTVAEPTLLQTFRHDESVYGAVFSRNDQRVLTWSYDNTVRLWDVSQTTTEATPLQTFRHDGSVYGAVFSRDEQRVLTWSIDGTARLWNVSQTTKEPMPLQTFRHDESVYGAALSRDEQRVLTWSADGAVRLWEVSQTSSEPVSRQPFRHRSSVFGAEFSLDERQILSWSADGTARLWDVSQPTPFQTFLHKDAVNGAVFSRGEQRVLTWSDDGTARMWDVSQTAGEPTLLQTFRHDNSVIGAVVSRDDQRILTWTNSWLHVQAIQPDANAPTGRLTNWSCRLPGRILNKPTWSENKDRFLIAQRWPDQRSVTIKRLNIGKFDATPIPGDPITLLQTWQERLGLVIDGNGEIVPLRPLRSAKAESSL